MEPSIIDVSGLNIAYFEDGPAGGPLALCLHGFPDTAHTWRHLMPVLAERGYHVVAPFLRGYGPTGVPSDGRYQTGALARDANRLHEVLGGDGEAILVGHDWGALAGYAAVTHQPDRWRCLVAAAVPPPTSVLSGFFSYDQLQRSWYTFFFQSPLAEIALGLDDYSFIDRLWADWSPGYDASWDLARVKESIGAPERMLAAISYYRALYNGDQHDPDLAAEQAASMGPVPRPTLYLHGSNDQCMGLDAISDPLAALAEGSEMKVLDGAGHFLHLEQPDELARLVVGFVGP